MTVLKESEINLLKSVYEFGVTIGKKDFDPDQGWDTILEIVNR